MSDDLADWIAEDIWRKVTRGSRQSTDEVRTAWLDLPEREKEPWRMLAGALIQDLVPANRGDLS